VMHRSLPLSREGVTFA
jgi:hypothetical protein